MMGEKENRDKNPSALHQHLNLSKLAWLALMVCILLLASCGPSTSTPTGTSHPGSSITKLSTAPTGCGKKAPTSPGGSANETLTSGGLTRHYLLHIPTGYQPNQRQAIILSFHGHAGSASQQEQYSGLSELADQQNFIAVYPQGTIGPDHRTGWASGGRTNPTVNDVLFTSDLLNHLQASLCIDPRRIYATGFSNGGGMTGLLACDLAGRIAAFAPVAGAFHPVAGGCHPSRPVPILEFHGTGDSIVNYTGVSSESLPPIPQWLQAWAMRDGCTGGPTTFFHNADVTGEQWTGCQAGTTVIHYRIEGGGHTWPGATSNLALGPTTHTINATMLMWQFFQTHPLPAA